MSIPRDTVNGRNPGAPKPICICKIKFQNGINLTNSCCRIICINSMKRYEDIFRYCLYLPSLVSKYWYLGRFGGFGGVVPLIRYVLVQILSFLSLFFVDLHINGRYQ